MPLPQAPAAPLLLIGGGSGVQPVELLRLFVGLAGGPGRRVAVITSGSRVPEIVGPRYERLFGSLGVDAQASHLLDRTTAADPAHVRVLKAADAFFFTGGEQLCITARLGGTPALAAIRERHLAGAPLGGTSAGTSCMSTTMIAWGNEGETPHHNIVNLAPGLGFLPGVLLDQHFTQRQRLGRLITAVSYNPEELGVGIDEDTAGLFRPDGTLEVHGPGTVTVVDGLPVQLNTSPDVEDVTLPLQIEGLRIHRLAAGAVFDLRTRRAGAARAAA